MTELDLDDPKLPGAEVPSRLRITAKLLRTVFILELGVLTLCVTMPERRTLFTEYATWGDLVGVALGSAICVGLATQLFKGPEQGLSDVAPPRARRGTLPGDLHRRRLVTSWLVQSPLKRSNPPPAERGASTLDESGDSQANHSRCCATFHDSEARDMKGRKHRKLPQDRADMVAAD
jgi:hypothetical protein